MRILTFVVLVLGFSGCATRNYAVKEVGENKYTVAAVGNSFTSANTVFESAVESGKKFCAEKGKKFDLQYTTGDPQGVVVGDSEQRIIFTCK